MNNLKNNNMKKISIILLSLFIPFGSCSKKPTDNDIIPYNPPGLTNTTWVQIEDPESAGWSTEKLQRAYTFSKKTQAAAVMIIYDGKVLFYWGDITKKFYIHSCRKSLLSALYGIHVANNSGLIYEIGVESAFFTSGPGGGWIVTSWREIE